MKKITLLLLTLCVSFMSYAQFPESFDGGTTIPSGWAVYDNGIGTTHSWTVDDVNENVSVRWSEILPAGQIAEDWIVTPQVAVTATTNLLTFEMTDFNAPDYNSQVTVRISTDASQTNTSAFTTVLTIDELDTNGGGFLPWSVDLSTYIGSSVYVAFVMENNDGDGWALDNVDFTVAPTCANPVATFDAFAQSTVDISMTTANNYDIEWGVFPYTQGGGGSTATVTADDSYQLTGLIPGASYNVFVRQNCGGGDYSEYIELIVGTSPSNSIPFSEDLEAEANQALLLNLGLSFAGNGDWNYNVDDTTDGDTTNDYAYDGVASIFSNNTTTTVDADARLYVGPFNLSTLNEYTFSFFQRNIATSSFTRPNKDIDITISTSNDGTTDTVILSLDDLDNITYTQRMATFTPTVDGEYYFGIHDKSSFLATATQGNSVVVDAFSVTSESLSVTEFNANTFKHFYNKNSQSLIIESSNLAMTSVEIYSLLGQNIISKSLSNTTETIDVSSLSTGVYLAKVSINGNTETIKFAKN
ncbi:T9SS-dependent choice-of-anchor J family protein [Winogradskyella thalassocola]|uniref:Por secretion system C-terminal sorting domain-containing protein n=1 Tax=Winogradskyella thalassocola TaxID=262004 RepID=A0A1G8K524_9FLAO|nr:choice-of-anchor J domain-containing protein [Winogradskyella thalassocola]SDI37910.1 Por secretion system C-terminal sorting domain-containing protein [Winogradskyella thalassocola]